MGSSVLALYERALRREDRRRSARRCSIPTCRRTTTGRGRQSLLPRPSRRRCTWPARSLYERPQALTEFVALVAPPPCPRAPASCCVAAAGAGPRRRRSRPRRSGHRADGGRAIAMDAATTAALQKLLDDPATTAAALPIVAKWDKAGALSASADRHASVLRVSSAIRRRATIAVPSSPRACWPFPKRRPQALAAIAPMLVDPARVGLAQGAPHRDARRERRQTTWMP